VGSAAALVVVGVVLAVVLSGGKNDSASTLPTRVSTASGLPGAVEVNALLKGIPQRGLTLGAASAPVTLVEYIDLQCPFCRELETQVMPNIIKRYVRPGKVKLEARVLAFIGPDSVRGREAMLAAAQQNKAFQFAQLLYENQGTENTGWLNDAMIDRATASIPGLNSQAVSAARDSTTVKQQGAALDAEGKAAKVTGTPTLFVARSGGEPTQVPLQSPTDEATLVREIQAVLGR
jgi:protein-disulfide isomerase